MTETVDDAAPKAMDSLVQVNPSNSLALASVANSDSEDDSK